MKTINELNAGIRSSLVLDRLARQVQECGVRRAADRANKSTRWMYRRISGETKTTLYDLELICEAIGIQPADLFN